MKTRHEIDGTVTLTLEDGRSFTCYDDQDRGVLTIEGVESDVIVIPLSASAISLDTPYD